MLCARIIMDFRLGGAHNMLLAEEWSTDADSGPGKRIRYVWLVDYDRWRDENWSATEALINYHTRPSPCKGTPLIARFYYPGVKHAIEWAEEEGDKLCALPEHDLSL